MRRFHCPELPGAHKPRVLLALDVSHHLLRVVGIAPDEEVVLFDGKGESCIAVLIGVSDGCARMFWRCAISSLRPQKKLCLLMALLRQQAFSTVIRMATEIGVQQLIPVACERSIAQGAKNQRWLRIAQAASGQAGRSDQLQIKPLMSPVVALQAIEGFQERWVCTPGAPLLQSTANHCAIWIGPEGGLSDREIQLAHEAGFVSAGLGPLTLRADTAAIVALAHFLC